MAKCNRCSLLMYVLDMYKMCTNVCDRHAQDVREHYQHKLQRANNLYIQLTACVC